MARVKSIAARRHKKVLKEARGMKHAAGKRFKAAHEAILHKGQYAFNGRKRKKRDLRALWITRLGAAAREEGLSYNKLVSGLKEKKIELDRKVLSDIAARDPETFKEIVSKIK